MYIGHSRNRERQCFKISPVQHQVLDLRTGDGARAFRAFRVDFQRIRFDRYLGGRAANGEHDVTCAPLSRIELYPARDTFLEAGFCNVDCIQPIGEPLDRIKAAAISRLLIRDRSALVGNGHLGAHYGSAG